jgi:hypothetical protein
VNLTHSLTFIILMKVSQNLKALILWKQLKMKRYFMKCVWVKTEMERCVPNTHFPNLFFCEFAYLIVLNVHLLQVLWVYCHTTLHYMWCISCSLNYIVFHKYTLHERIFQMKFADLNGLCILCDAPAFCVMSWFEPGVKYDMKKN